MGKTIRLFKSSGNRTHLKRQLHKKERVQRNQLIKEIINSSDDYHGEIHIDHAGYSHCCKSCDTAPYYPSLARKMNQIKQKEQLFNNIDVNCKLTHDNSAIKVSIVTK